MLLKKEAITQAARDLLVLSIEEEIENGAEFIPADVPDETHCANSLADGIIENHADDVMFAMGFMIGSISQAWGHDVGLVFYHMGLEDADDQAEPLYRLLMSCFGHGIAIDDDGPSGPMATAFDKAGEKLLNIVKDAGARFDHSPCNFDQHTTFVDPLVSPHLNYKDEE